LLKIFDLVSESYRPSSLQSKKVGNEFLSVSGISNIETQKSCFWDIKIIQDPSNIYEINILLNKNGVSQELSYKG
jgi:hypothetical protein